MKIIFYYKIFLLQSYSSYSIIFFMMFWINLILLFVLIPFGLAGLSLAPFVPTRWNDVKRAVKLANLQPWQRFIEIGCWDSRVTRAIGRAYPEAIIEWIEISPLLYIISKLKGFFTPQKNVTIHFWDAFKLNYGKYDCIYTFSMRESLAKKLWPKLQKEMKKWSRIISYVFEIEGWKWEEIKDKPSKEILAIYI